MAFNDVPPNNCNPEPPENIIKEQGNSLLPETCDPNFLPNPANFPKLGPNLEGLGADITDYLCDILKVSDRKDLDPVISRGKEFDDSIWVNSLTGLHDVGDPRMPMGTFMKEVLDKYMKPLETQLRILQDGCCVQNGVLCDREGNEIPDYGPCEEPSKDLFKYENMIEFGTNLWLNALKTAADNFIRYIRSTYINKGWSISCHAFGKGLDFKKIKYGKEAPMFYIKLTKGKNVKYYKYFFYEREAIAKAFDVKINIINIRKFQEQNYKNPDFDLMEVLAGPIWPETAD